MFKDIVADMMRVPQEIRGERRVGTLRPNDALRLLSKNYGLQALVIYRFGRWLSGVRERRFGGVVAIPLFPAYRLLSAYARAVYGINLEQSADIAPGLYIGHFGGIEVRNCRLGPRCAIHQQVKLGPAENAVTTMGPVIGEGVWIGAHAQIYAAVCVGDGATIGVGAVVTEEIPPRCLVLGNPGRIAQRNYDNQTFL